MPGKALRGRRSQHAYIPVFHHSCFGGRMITITWLDAWIIFGFLASVVLVGSWAAKRAGQDTEAFFLSGRNMPWWLLGVSMVACTFSCDTPNLITEIVRMNGVAGNWVWWAFLLTGMLTVFVYAKLWRRSGLNTDLGFYELRYSGPPAAFLRGFFIKTHTVHGPNHLKAQLVVQSKASLIQQPIGPRSTGLPG